MLGWLNYGWIMVDTCLNKVGDAPHLGLTHEDLEIESASDNLSVLHFFMVGSMLIFPGLVTSWCLYVRACILCASLCWLVLLAFTIQIHFEPAAFAEATLPCPCHSLTFGPPQGEKKPWITGNQRPRRPSATAAPWDKWQNVHGYVWTWDINQDCHFNRELMIKHVWRWLNTKI